MGLRPPIDESFNFLFITRQYEDNKLTIFLPNGDSYYLSSSEIREYLRLLGFEDFDSAVDYVWNFYSIAVDLVSGTYVWVDKDRIKEEVENLRKSGVDQ